MAVRNEEQKKVGIMGGTFDPIHIGHLILAEQAYSQYGLDEVWFMPSSQPPHKERGGVSPAKDRGAMVELAIRGNDHFVYSELELNREGTTYTSDTLEELDEAYPDIRFYFLMGADSLFTIETWHEPQKIFDRITILAAGRDEAEDAQCQEQAEYLMKKYGGEVHIIHMENIGISSSEIRMFKRQGLSVRYYVPDAVCDYITENGLYKEG